MRINFKKYILLVIFIVISVPFFQYVSRIFDEKSLKGEFVSHSKPGLDSLQTKWFEGGYQYDYEKYFNEKFGFRPSFVRLFNQIKYTLFNKANSAETILGKNGGFYDSRYIMTYLGKDFIGKEAITKKIEDLLQAKKYLEEENKHILIVIAPNKARYYREEIPDSFKVVGKTNYDELITQFKKNKIDYIDFNNWFLSQKGKLEGTLISKYGIHWTEYATDIVVDSIITYCNQKYNYNLPTYHINSYVKTHKAQFQDNDILNTNNLLITPTDELYIYSNKTIMGGPPEKRILALGDSFYNGLYYQGFAEDVFINNGFWYYNKKIIQENKDKSPEELFKTLPTTDLVLILQTEWNLYRLGFGIIEEINSYYNGDKIEDFIVRDQIEKIRANKEWFENVKKQAIERNLTLDSMLVRSAKYILEQKKKKD